MDILNYINKMQEMYEGPRNMVQDERIGFDAGGDAVRLKAN